MRGSVGGAVARIFVSYAREDVAAAEAFAGVLERAGHEVWWDSRIRAGSRYSRDIASALDSAEAVIVLWSKSSIESDWVQDEAAEGLEGSRLVPTTLDGCRPPLGFRQYQTIDMVGWRAGAAAFKRLLETVDSKLAETEEPSVSTRVAAREAARAQPSICVVPFVNMSGDAEQEYFSDGITEDVITDLCKVSALAVAGRNASFALKGQTVDMQRLASELAVSHVLEGTVRKSAARLRVTAQLTDTSSGRSLWAERYDRELSDVFEIQEEISHAIVEALQVTLLPQEASAINERSTSSARAYDLYLRARGHWAECEPADARRNAEIARLCGEAVELDPDYASAWALLALASAELRFWTGEGPDAVSAAERAMTLDARLPEPHCVRARMFEEHGDDDSADAAVELALALKPDSWEANREAAQILFRRGSPGDAIPYFEKAADAERIDHHSPAMLICCHRATGDSGGAARAAEMAVFRAERAIICDPANGAAFASAAAGFAALGECDRARRWIRKALNVDPGNLAMRYGLAATLAAGLGDTDGALDALEPFAEAVALLPHLRLLGNDPSWARLRGLPRFEAMVQRARKRAQALAGGAVTC
jgi:adenylate cyclase